MLLTAHGTQTTQSTVNRCEVLTYNKCARDNVTFYVQNDSCDFANGIMQTLAAAHYFANCTTPENDCLAAK